MKFAKQLLCLQIMVVAGCFTGCSRTQSDVWEDTRTCGRYMGCGLRSLGGKQGYSEQVGNPDEFGEEGQPYDFYSFEDGDAGYQEFPMADVAYPQAKELPGDPGSSIPGIQAFKDPSLQPELAAIFKNVYFDFDSPLVKGEANLQAINGISQYLQKHPDTFIFIEGHTDERGPAAYNMALGAQRANTVRNLLIDQGAHPDHLFTISYGKERPVVMEHHEDGWRQNRRTEFKIYQR